MDRIDNINNISLDKIASDLDKFFNYTVFNPEVGVYYIKRQVCNIHGTGFRVEVRTSDHNPPHFHIISNQRDINASFSIDTLEVIEKTKGDIKDGDIAKIKKFFSKNPHYLFRFYKRILE